MKKLTLSIGLVAAIMSAKAQDTTQVMITEEKVYYYQDKNIKPTKSYLHHNKIVFYVKENELLRLHLWSNKLKTRKVTTIYQDNKKNVNILDSKDNLYFSPLGPFKVIINKSKFITN